MKKQFYILFLAVALSISALSGCSSQSTSNTAESADTETEALSATPMKSWSFDEDDYYTETTADTAITLNGSDADINGNGAEVNDGNIIISSSGVYELTGSFSGSIIVNTDKDSEVQILLNNVDITSIDGPVLYVEQCGKTIVSTVENSVNNLTDSTEYTLLEGEDEPDAAVFSKDDIVINGLGTLNVDANYNDGIKGKDNLLITGGTINVTAVDDGITGRDILAVTEADINVECGGDAFKTTNSEESEKGELYIEGGTIALSSDGDGMDSANAIYFNDGDVTINTGEGADSVSVKYTGEFKRNDTFDMDDEADGSTDTTSSQKGIKAKNIISVSGGILTTDTVDDSIHSNDEAYVSAGNLNISSGDDGIHADNNLEISGGLIDILKCYEGLEGFNITILDGDISIYADDDGINAAEGSSDTDTAGGNIGGAMGGTSGCNITISGGHIYVNADGDGIDSNDLVSMTGGTLIANGPTNNGNGTFDFQNSMVYDGGTLIASGSSGMLQVPDSSSKTSCVVMLFSSTQSSGKGVVLTTSDGEIVAAVAPNKEYTAITIGSDKIESGKEYKIVYGAELTGNAENGVFNAYEIGSSEGEVSFTVSDTITYVDENGITDSSSIGGGMQVGGMNDGKMQGGKMNFDGTSPSGEAPSGEMPEGDRPSSEVPSGGAPNGEVPSRDRPSGGAPNEEAPTDDVTAATESTSK